MGRKGIAALICEPFLVVPGLHILPQNYFERLYATVRENGGVFIADENQTGLGRIGTHNWAFQKTGIIPDIVTTGTSIGNGHPMVCSNSLLLQIDFNQYYKNTLILLKPLMYFIFQAAVICKREISDSLRGYFSTFGGNPVACSIGLAVLRVLKNEKLKSSANNVGRVLASLLSNIMNKYPEKVGDIRGQGLIWALEIVQDNNSKEADPKFARLITDLMRKNEKILLGLTGMHNNVLLFTPPLCFTVDNSRRYFLLYQSFLKTIRLYTVIYCILTVCNLEIYFRFVKSLDNSIANALAAQISEPESAKTSSNTNSNPTLKRSLNPFSSTPDPQMHLNTTTSEDESNKRKIIKMQTSKDEAANGECFVNDYDDLDQNAIYVF